MKFKFYESLKTMLLLAVAALVILTGIIVSQLVIKNYSTALLTGAIARAESIAHKLALDLTDKILINDLVAIQKILDDQLQSEKSVFYLFIMNNDKVLVHTFSEGVPVSLVTNNKQSDITQKVISKLESESGDRFIDIQWPIFEGKAGVLRLGLSEGIYRSKVEQLRMKMTVVTFLVLLISLIVSHLLISYLLRPFTRLTNAVKEINEDNLDIEIQVKGPAEINRLVTAYNGMFARISKYTAKLKKYNQQLKQKNIDLDRAHKQMMTTFSVSQKIASLPDLKGICSYIVATLHEIVECSNLSMIIFDNDQKLLYLADGKNFLPLKNEIYDALYENAGKPESPIFLKNTDVKALPLEEHLKTASRMAIFPFHHHKEVLGAVIISCPDDCVCVKTEMDVIKLILKQASGAVFRAFEHDREIKGLKNKIETVSGFMGMVGKDPKIQNIYKLIEDVAPTDATVLIQGESGTGKEMVAKALHDVSSRAQNPFIVINCSAYPATLLESELFGHEKGAFTGAVQRKKGRFEQADRGTVFLDEIGEITLSAQTMLLRVLQSQKIERIGGHDSIRVDTRILAATNRNLIEAVKTGNFREDLYYRLNVIPIHLPSLKERKIDIPLLAKHFLKKYAAEQGKTILDLDSETMRLLLNYDWPGNIRELENIIEHAVTLSKSDQIYITDLPDQITAGMKYIEPHKSKILKATEEELIRSVLEECKWNKTTAAARLGISRSTLYEKFKRFNIIQP
ncbi:MAG: sigma 54-interacting transcriptional regulator [Pseudomonadota bacterium]